MAELGKKYHVVRVEDNTPVDDAFVLRVKRDPVGWLASWHYANLTYNADLARDLRAWLLQNVPDESTLGTEGQINRLALEEVRKVKASEESITLRGS